MTCACPGTGTAYSRIDHATATVRGYVRCARGHERQTFQLPYIPAPNLYPQQTAMKEARG